VSKKQAHERVTAMVLIKSRASGRYVASNTSRTAFTSNVADAYQFASAVEAEGYIYEVQAQGVANLYDSNRANMQMIVDGKAESVRSAAGNDGPRGYGW